MTKDQIVQACETNVVRLDGVIERTFVWIDIECNPTKHNPSTFLYQPPFQFKYTEWVRHGNFISRYVVVSIT